MARPKGFSDDWVLVRYLTLSGKHFRLAREHNTARLPGMLMRYVPYSNEAVELFMIFERTHVPSVLTEIDWRDRAPQ